MSIYIGTKMKKYLLQVFSMSFFVFVLSEYKKADKHREKRLFIN